MKRSITLNLGFIFWLGLFGSISFAQVETPRNPNSAKACAICHYRWVDTFFVDGKGSDLVAYQPEKVVATPEMCLSCHDGSVADSRARVFNDRHEHKTNQPPPSDMKIPEIFPLDKDNNMQCATCHTAHGVPSGTAVEETIFMRTSNRNSAMCRGCHPDMDGGINAGNHPVDTTEKEIPPTLMALGAVGGAKNNQVICETCHTAHGSTYDSLLIKSTENSDFCLDCHRDKNMFTPEGKKNPSHIIDARPSKVKIPEILMQSGAKLGKNGIITCQTCHKVHTNKIEKQLLV
ncbi:MAG: cytochrome c3 family protein, partial [Desulfobacterales bacterium]|nr:cytochrome c3 family protein [Desulfobacterales bacterium]